MDATVETLDKAVVFLAKRDGIDKVLKLIRYTAKLVLSAKGVKDGSPAYAKLKSLDQSLGTTRKALRLGKFLSNVKSANAVNWSSPRAPAQVLAATGEGVYYFLDQFIWLVKSGVLDPRLEAKLSKASAWAELVGYAASIYLNLLALDDLKKEELTINEDMHQAARALQEHAQEGREVAAAAASACIARLCQRRDGIQATTFLRTLLLVQDASDSLIAIHEVSDGRVPFVNPVVLAICGLISGSISSWKNWPALVGKEK